MPDDAELLRRYLDDQADDAFSALVQRHIGHVYATALRRVGHDAHLAEDVTQQVFADLARKASTLRRHASIGGWLQVSAHLASAALVRREQRRKTREADLSLMPTSTPAAPAPADDPALRAALDEALIALKAPEREALVLRFFQQQSFAEVGAALRVSEEAARKRVDRALEKLRARLARLGITSTATALGAILATSCAIEIPGALSSKIAGHALAQATVGGSAGIGVGAALLKTLWPAAAVLFGGAVWLATEAAAQRQRRAELTAQRIPPAAFAALRAESQALRAKLDAAETLRSQRREIATLREQLAATSRRPPASTAQPAQSGLRPVIGTVVVSQEGTLAWLRPLTDPSPEPRPIRLGEFTTQLRALQNDAPDHGIITIVAPGAQFSALAYAVDEARKAGIKSVMVESDARPNGRIAPWF